MLNNEPNARHKVALPVRPSLSRLHSIHIADQIRIPPHMTTHPLAPSLFYMPSFSRLPRLSSRTTNSNILTHRRASQLFGLLFLVNLHIRTFFFDTLEIILSLPLPLIFTTTTATTTTTSTSLAFADEDTGRYQRLTQSTSELLELSFTNLASADNFKYLSAFVRWPLDTCWHPRGAGSIH